jgi:peptidoglycan biosynthesis protein MviN/MurJ (putative lipid II flippase)
LGAALFSEVLLRLVLVTTVAAFVLRRMGAARLEAGAAGVVAAAVVQVLLYLPAVMDVGFASATAAAG